jgi:hypothetical protein
MTIIWLVCFRIVSFWVTKLIIRMIYHIIIVITATTIIIIMMMIIPFVVMELLRNGSFCYCTSIIIGYDCLIADIKFINDVTINNKIETKRSVKCVVVVVVVIAVASSFGCCSFYNTENDDVVDDVVDE